MLTPLVLDLARIAFLAVISRSASVLETENHVICLDVPALWHFGRLTLRHLRVSPVQFLQLTLLVLH